MIYIDNNLDWEAPYIRIYLNYFNRMIWFPDIYTNFNSPMRI